MNAVGGQDAAIHYLGSTLSRSELRSHANALADYLSSEGVTAGDRILLQLQNMPEVAITCMAAWSLGAVVVPVNPMYKARELQFIAEDCRPAAAIVLDELIDPVVVPALQNLPDMPLIGTAGAAYADEAIAAELRLPSTSHRGMTFTNLGTGSRRPAADNDGPRATNPPGAVAALIYTSGTTGPPKGAVIQHRNLDAEVALWKAVYQFRPGDSIMSIAPFSHITGLVADLVVGLETDTPVVCCYRFHPAQALRWIDRYQPTSMVAAITAYTALLNEPGLTTERARSLRTCLSGGAPVSPVTVQRWEARTGHYIRNCYGLTESTSLVTMTPPDIESPIDPLSGALSVGKAVATTRLEIRDDQGGLRKPREAGEVVIAGPQVSAGYWERERETAETFAEGVLHTGDVGFLDEDNWLYLIDRKKDLIVTSGYKVWPREVEELLMQHPAVLEAGVVGSHDSYRGEQVIAYVSLRPGSHADPQELIEFCRQNAAAFKSPRQIVILDELPKTPSGKILRRELRDGH